MFEEAGCADVRTYIQSGNVHLQRQPGQSGKAPRR